MDKLLVLLDRFMWEYFLIYILLIVGVFLTIRMKGMQLKYLPYSLKLAFSRHDDNAKGDISQFQSLMTAMAATIGIGSIAGMATAIIGGGFGAIFWMWIMALIGMVTKYSEAILAVKFREVDHRGQMCGGPMYYIEKGLKSKWLGACFAIFGALAAFAGGNMIQSQSIADAAQELWNIQPVWTSSVLMVLSGIVILGGIRTLGKFNAFLVPIMAVLYLSGGITILTVKAEYILPSIGMIIKDAFTGRSIAGGFIGGGILTAMQMGIARGISSNEAGLGSAPIASAAAKTDVPGRQALISMSGVFLSSFVVCTITVLVVAVTGVAGSYAESGRLLNGAPLVMKAFDSVIPHGRYIVALGLMLFGFSTILGWSYYGEKCMEYLFHERIIPFYRILFILMVFGGGMMSINVVWPLADIMNGLMALPNLISLLLLSGIVAKESKSFFALVRKERKKEKKMNA